MSILGIDLGGTKLATGIFDEAGQLLSKESIALDNRAGDDVGLLVQDQIEKCLTAEGDQIQAIGISVPGIAYSKTGTVWAPNIAGWDAYPLLEQVRRVAPNIPVTMDSDRACYILGEVWQGNARNCKDAIYLAVGTGIGAGILVNGSVLRGADDIAGAIGWMALSTPFKTRYISCGCFEYYASGRGITRLTNDILSADPSYQGPLRRQAQESITAPDVFAAYNEQDPLAKQVIGECITFWGMAVANLVSIFNPETIIFGGGVFGPAVEFIPAISDEATKWAQPVSIKNVSFTASALGSDAGMYGAGSLALSTIQTPS